jgi:hypothetical protein
MHLSSKFFHEEVGRRISLFAVMLVIGSIQQAHAGSWTVTISSSSGSSVGTYSGQSGTQSTYNTPATVTGSGTATIQYPVARTYQPTLSSASFGSCQLTQTLKVKTTLQWNPAPNMTMTSDPPPSKITVAEFSISTTSSAGSSVSGAVNNGFDDTEPPTGPNSLGSGMFGYSRNSQGTHFDTYDASSGTVDTIPERTITNSANASNSTLYFGTGAAPSGTHGWITYTVLLLALSAPDVNGHPDQGDGKNQFIYNTTSPNGVLNVPGSITYSGATQAQAQALVDQHIVNLKVENSVIPNEIAYTLSVANNIISILTTGYSTGNWVYNGLPANNSSFGNHDVNLYVNGSIAQTAKIQTFFNGTASNFPSSTGAVPNWYNYYSQVYASPGQYLSGGNSYTEASTPYAIHLENDCYNSTGYSSLRVFYVDTTTTPQRCKFAGYLTVPNGILQYVHTNAHERGHRTAFQTNATTPPYNPIRIGYADSSDADGDHVVDSWEIGHKLDPSSPDTTGAYGVQANGDKGDDELLADILALPVLINLIDDWKQDWANGGMQYGALGTQLPIPIVYSLPFTPATSSNGHSTPTGPTVGVRSIADINALSPQPVLTSLP